ncbi:hypothetical protein Acsp05_22040 [Actinokineospora sp. NBRC 105648]|nr:hypothetical protein Acsp05_22040 [Actinokineospora sp. NBRC 105648]
MFGLTGEVIKMIGSRTGVNRSSPPKITQTGGRPHRWPIPASTLGNPTPLIQSARTPNTQHRNPNTQPRWAALRRFPRNSPINRHNHTNTNQPTNRSAATAAPNQTAAAARSRWYRGEKAALQLRDKIPTPLVRKPRYGCSI